MDDFFAGTSSAVLKKVHRQRLLAFGVALVIFTWALWVLVRVLWMVTPYTPPRRFLVDVLSISVVPLFHGLAAFFRYLVCDADDAPRRRSGSTLALPNPGQALATVAAHGLVGACLGLYAWIILAADEGGKAANDSGALGGLAVAGAACSAWSAFSFLKERRHHLRFGLPNGAAIGSHLLAEAGDSVKEGVYSGVVLAAGYLVLRFVSDIFPGSLVGRALAPIFGLSAHIATASTMSSEEQVGEALMRERAGKLAVTYLILLSTTANFALHGFLTKIMNFIIVAPQDFLRLWQASIAALSEQGGAGSSGGVPSSPAAMLLDSLSIGHETVLRPAERDFLQARGLNVDSPHARGPMADWTDEMELQRRAIALTCMEPPRTARRGGKDRAAPATRGVVVPVWAQVAKAQALQSLALKAPRDKDLRGALYEVNVAQVLRTLCLELDETSLLLQVSAFRYCKADAARSLGCEGRGDVRWLVEGMASASSSSPGETGRRWLSWLNEGLSLPYPLDRVLAAIAVALRSAFSGGGGGRGGGGGAGGGGRHDGAEIMSAARLQSAIWASEGMSALMIRAPGESRVWSLDTMLPVVLGSLAGLLIAVKLAGGDVSGDEGEDAAAAAPAPEGSPQQQQQKLVSALEKALKEVSTKYRSCLADFRFPPAYATTINRLCAP